jgi:endonuclease III
VARLREALNEVYIREHAVSLESLAAKVKKDQRVYLETLPGIPVYVTASVMLLSYGGHAIPVDSKLATLLAEEGVVTPDSDSASTEAVLLRQVKAGDGFETHLVLQAWSDASRKASPKKIEAEARDATGVVTKQITRKKKTTRSSARRAKKK